MNFIIHQCDARSINRKPSSTRHSFGQMHFACWILKFHTAFVWAIQSSFSSAFRIRSFMFIEVITSFMCYFHSFALLVCFPDFFPSRWNWKISIFFAKNFVDAVQTSNEWMWLAVVCDKRNVIRIDYYFVFAHFYK